MSSIYMVMAFAMEIVVMLHVRGPFKMNSKETSLQQISDNGAACGRFGADSCPSGALQDECSKEPKGRIFQSFPTFQI